MLATGLAGAMQTLALLGLPLLMVVGAALAQIAVSASFATITAGARELDPRPRRVLARCGAGQQDAGPGLLNRSGLGEHPRQPLAGVRRATADAIGVVWLGVLGWSPRTSGLDRARRGLHLAQLPASRWPACRTMRSSSAWS